MWICFSRPLTGRQQRKEGDACACLSGLEVQVPQWASVDIPWIQRAPPYCWAGVRFHTLHRPSLMHPLAGSGEGFSFTVSPAIWMELWASFLVKVAKGANFPLAFSAAILGREKGIWLLLLWVGAQAPHMACTDTRVGGKWLSLGGCYC